VRLNYLSLTNYRNYVRLELRLSDRLTLIQGANAQGKTNLLEAIHLLATGRSPRAGAERELINWLAIESPLPYARLVAEMGVGKDAQKIELVLEPVQNANGLGPTVRKQVRINDAPKRALDLVGRLRVVLFLPEDVSLVAGAPSERRRYLDIALCQISNAYCRSLSEYNRILTQRNALLKRLREQGGDSAQLSFWDAQLAEQGSHIVHHRVDLIHNLQAVAVERHRDLTGGQERLHLAYLPSFDVSAEPSPRAAGAKRRTAESQAAYHALTREDIQRNFLGQLRHGRSRDVAAGTSLLGPHRDDMSFAVNDRDVRVYGSRGQQRTAALALKLAEVQVMKDKTDDSPLLLLDDVMSELDEARRHTLLDALASVSQAIVTTTDWNDFSPALLSEARKLHVAGGVLQPADAPTGGVAANGVAAAG